MDLLPAAWDRFVGSHLYAHVLQTSPWGELKASVGWTAQRVALAADGEPVAGAQLLYRRLPGGVGKLAYVPRGPVVDWSDGDLVQAVVMALEREARRQGAIALILEPGLDDEPRWREQLASLGLTPSPLGSVQPRRTIVVDVSPSEEDILAAFKSKTRYNVRLAERKGVKVRETQDLDAFQLLMETTAERDEFGIHSGDYYGLAVRLFVPRGWARLLVAEVEGEPVGALMVFALGHKSWYFYGASANVHREKMPAYLLQWEAMRWARSAGATEYDLWGVPDEELDQLEAQFSQRGDGLWGVYRFKRGFGGQLKRSVGAWELGLRPVLYRLYTLAARLMRTGID